MDGEQLIRTHYPKEKPRYIPFYVGYNIAYLSEG